MYIYVPHPCVVFVQSWTCPYSGRVTLLYFDHSHLKGRCHENFYFKFFPFDLCTNGGGYCTNEAASAQIEAACLTMKAASVPMEDDSVLLEAATTCASKDSASVQWRWLVYQWRRKVYTNGGGYDLCIKRIGQCNNGDDKIWTFCCFLSFCSALFL